MKSEEKTEDFDRAMEEAVRRFYIQDVIYRLECQQRRAEMGKLPEGTVDVWDEFEVES